ncbi:hypothetical protein BDN67DRAFT_985699 [Paxillus ammoniavirescens]|nr:hypothetical protein BDN67DRAFT_985699 [Paxillus ammoniavirescens]
MGRPKLHKTPEEKVLAARSYRQKYYESAGRPRHDEVPIGVGMEGPVAPRPCEQSITAAQIEQSLRDTTGGSSQTCANGLCRGFIVSGDYSSIYSAVDRVQALELHLQVLRSGPSSGDTTTMVKEISWCICLVVRVLEDLLMNAMEGADIAQMHHRSVLLYQSAEDIN